MPHSQKNQSHKLEVGLQAEKEAQGLMGSQVPVAEEKKATASLLSSLIQGTPEVVPTAGTQSVPQSSQGACSSSTTIEAIPLSKSNEDSSQEESPSGFQAPTFLLGDVLNKKLAQLVQLMRVKYVTKEPITKAGILENG